MQAWLASLAPGGLIMCHPAMVALPALPGLAPATGMAAHRGPRAGPAPRSERGGPARPQASGLALARLHELEYLCGSEFEADCRQAGRLPVRFRAPRPG
jgi:hypothetical protein